ncbi:HNH endonuclease-domain-containing protein [Peziza echinospora]|nr:HNH endonuclease-domain-containing protein [Peziza echinospora]
MTSHRSHFRNIHFYDGTKNNEPDALGGLIQNGSITEANFLDMLGILLVTEGAPIRVEHRTSGHVISRTHDRLEVGVYDIYCAGPIQVTDEPWVHRIISHNMSGRDDGFREGICARDGKCVISGLVNRMAPYDWSMFEAAHIFPLEKEGLWVQWNCQQWITDMDNTTGISKINSCQNGFLLQPTVHGAFDQYSISVNPDDNHKIVVFGVDILVLDGRTLDPVCRNPEDPHRVSDELLRWHFRQSVLANMRGAGEPTFEHDFPPGTDIMKEIREGPCAKERFELELAARLGAAV